jgi:DNA-binding CsgD family transcriptional regulator
MNNLFKHQTTNFTDSTYVVFVGSHLTFSKHALRILQAEHSEMEFHRVCNLSDLDDITAERDDPVLIVVDETIFIPLLDDPEKLIRLSSGGCLTLAYRDPNTARDLIAKTGEIDAIGDIGVLPLNAEIEVWLSMFNLLLCGEVLYPRAIIDALQETAANLQAELDIPLTPREWEILQMVAKGQQNKMIATALDLSEHTVKLHVHHVLKKLGVNNRTSAAGWFASHGADK